MKSPVSPGPELTPGTLGRLRILFAEASWPAAEKILIEECGNNLPGLEQYSAVQLERFRFAALKVSDGSLAKLHGAVELAKEDWRDLLVGAGFGRGPRDHESWTPMPDGPAGRIDTEAIRGRLSQRLDEVLSPFGFR